MVSLRSNLRTFSLFMVEEHELLCAVLLIPQKPQKLRHMLSQYGEVGRVYLAPEGDHALHNL